MKIVIIEPVMRSQGGVYAPGSEIDVSEEMAARLIGLRVAVRAEMPAPPPAPAPPPPVAAPQTAQSKPVVEPSPMPSGVVRSAPRAHSKK
jgi:hypothetical protein